jgi:hypothetical protein
MHYALNDEVMKSGLNPGNSLKPGIESLLKARGLFIQLSRLIIQYLSGKR